MSKIVIWRSLNDQKYYWHMAADNGEVLCESEAYARRWGARRGARRFIKLVQKAKIVEEI